MSNRKQVRRFDSLDPARWMTVPFTRTAEGFLAGRAIVTGVGVFTYLNKDGSTTRELRLPEEVFSSESLASMKLKPVTNGHPAETVTPENMQAFTVGSLGSNPASTTQERSYEGFTPTEKLTDGFHVAIDMTVQRADAIEAVLNGKRALSMGYECEFESAEPGSVWCGMEYDGIQRNIRYNHCAVVDAARAGDAAKIRLDGADSAVQIKTDTIKPEAEVREMKKIHIDGIEYEGDEGLVLRFTEQRNRADKAEKELSDTRTARDDALSALEAARDAQKDRADKAEKELKELREHALDPRRIDEAVNAKLILRDAAERAGVPIKEDMSDTDVKKAVITALYPSAKLDGRDGVYIAARFDAALEALNGRDDAAGRETFKPPLTEGGRRSDAAAARERMIENMRAQSGRGAAAGGAR
jgi:hypothetical protein